jgi:hypothetical protein
MPNRNGGSAAPPGDVKLMWLRRLIFSIELATGRVRPLADKGLLDPP